MSRKFNLWDKKNNTMLGPFGLRENIEAVIVKDLRPTAKAVIRKDNIMIPIDDVGPRYLVRPEGETEEEYRRSS